MRKRLMAVGLVLVLIAAACGGDDSEDEATGGSDSTEQDGGGGDAGENTGEGNLLSAGEPEEVEAYQEIFDELINADADFEVEVEAAGNFEEQFQIRAEGGTLDVAAVPQPGAIADLAESGSIVSLEDLGFDIEE